MTFDLSLIVRETGINHLEFHAELDSTSRLAGQLLADLLPLAPALVLTDLQTSGRGRGNNAWWASKGALTFTLVLDAAAVPVPTNHRPMISLATGLAVRDVVAQLVPDQAVVLKWPNDVLVGSHKNCGILTELKYQDDRAAILIGIGINVNNSLATAPTDVGQRAVSCFDLTGESFDLTQVLIGILRALDQRIAQLAAAPDEICGAVNTHHLLNGKTVELSGGNKIWRGICLGVNPDGGIDLLINGSRQSFVAGTILKWDGC